MKKLINLMTVKFADHKTGKFIELTNIPMSPRINESFYDVDISYMVKDISIDLWNQKMFIYLQKIG